MPKQKKTRPTYHSERVSTKNREDIVTDARPFIAYYLFLAGLVAYGAACFVRDMNLI